MELQTPDYATLRDRILRDISSQRPDADVSSDSDNYVRASAVGATSEGIYQFLARVYRQIWPDTADSDELEKHASERGLGRRGPTAATGFITATGWVGTTVPAGSSVRHVNGTMLVTTQDMPIGADGTAVLRIAAVDAGAASNGLTGNVTFTAPPLGVDAGAVIATALDGGTDPESDASLLDRLLAIIRRPPAGGNKYDYKRWATSIAGVGAAYVYPLRRGLGTCDVVIVSNEGLPSAELVAEVQAYIDDQRPVTAWGTQVFGPSLIVQDVHAKVALASGYTLADVTSEAQIQLATAIGVLVPGDTLFRSRVEAAISGLAGVIDRELVTPATNVTATVDATTVQWIRCGVVTLELM